MRLEGGWKREEGKNDISFFKRRGDVSSDSGLQDVDMGRKEK